MSQTTMIKLLEIHSVQAAQLFASYCHSLKLQVSVVVQSAQQAELWCDEQQQAEVEQLWLEFIQQPGHPRYQAAAWQQAEPALSSGRSGLSGYWQQLWAQGGVLTHLIWLAAVLVFGWQQLAPWQAVSALQLQADYGLSLAQGWRWLTPAWLHFSGAHLVFNLIWVWYLLGPVEKRSGKLLATALVLAALLPSHLLQFVLAGSNFGGLSGLVYGLFGFYWICGWLKPAWGYQLSPGLIGFMLLWLVIGFADLLWIPMANWAHLGGLLGGMGLAAVLALTGRR
ncbi:rhomboid family intramembrane serine protease [Rheinheimera sp.]|uniref:rhomboid family intramembrane serine protease n=1 Tax=Rheinheimera sp. TaxID=1869214 RepID=UPI003AF5B93B